jgi:hypothetical protein
VTNSKDIVRSHIERIDGVSRTWLEWVDWGHEFLKVLVVEVDFDTDPNAAEFRQEVINAIRSTTDDVLQNETTLAIGQIRIIPQRR